MDGDKRKWLSAAVAKKNGARMKVAVVPM